MTHTIALITTITPSRLHGSIAAPPSKSVAQRAFAAALIRRGKTTFSGAGFSNDELAVLELLQQLGCKVARDETSLSIDSTEIKDAINRVNFGESGLAARMFIPLLALHDHAITFEGSGSLLNRPMDSLVDALTQLGVVIEEKKNKLPFTAKGPITPRSVVVDGAGSSQQITGLIMAFVAAGAEDVTLTVTNPVSTPYLALTLKVLDDLKLPTPSVNNDFTEFNFRRKNITNQPLTYAIEGDWSAAALLMVAGAIAGHVRITGLDVFTQQGDKAVLQALMDAGARLSITADEIVVSAAPLKAFHFNATDTPDLFPPLAVLAACTTHGTSVIEGVHRLNHKESNRAITLQDELGKMGVNITFQDDMMLIEGGAILQGAMVDSRGDHRIAMACAIAALVAAGETTIHQSEAVRKSYPHFFTDLQSLGALVAGL